LFVERSPARTIWELNEYPCRDALTGSAHQLKGREQRGPRHQETTLPKYLLLKRRAERPPPGHRHPRTTSRSSTDSKERKVMDPQEITEEPQDRASSWVGRHDEDTPQELAGDRS
jgi:hypothetical protein